MLLCRRAINPRYDYWTLPAGFMENEESLEQAAMRESVEEANASLENLHLYTIISLPHISIAIGQFQHGSYKVGIYLYRLIIVLCCA